MNKLICKKYVLSLQKPLIMGILNVTPDSFSDGGKYMTVEKAVDQAKKMVSEGADIIDIGGESTRPGSEAVRIEEELRRVLPVVDRLLKEISVPISIDTMKPEVADECLYRGVHILNDITGLRNEEMTKVAAHYNVPVIIMHMQGTPKVMQEKPHYNDVIKEIKNYLQKQAREAQKRGISQVIIDPGIGFGKTVEHNLLILKHLREFKMLDYPLLVGLSRKSFIGKILDLPVEDRLEGTLTAITACLLNGADIVRVHDVKECKRVLKVVGAIRDAT